MPPTRYVPAPQSPPWNRLPFRNAFMIRMARARLRDYLNQRQNGTHGSGSETAADAIDPAPEPPPPQDACGFLQTPAGAMRVWPRRAVMPGTGRYPDPPLPPAVPAEKRAAALHELGYFPQIHGGEHPRRWEWPTYLDASSRPWLAHLKTLYADPLSFPSSLSPEAGLLLHALVRNMRPRTIVETGMFIGISTTWMAGALQENGDGGTVHAFDDFSPIRKAEWREKEMPSGRLEFVAEGLCRAGVADSVVLHPGDSASELRAFAPDLRTGGGVELAFLDADHSVNGVWNDFWALEPALKTGGIVVLHDTFPMYCTYDGPRHLLDHLNTHAVGLYEKVDLYLAPVNYGLGVIRRIG